MLWDSEEMGNTETIKHYTGMLMHLKTVGNKKALRSHLVGEAEIFWTFFNLNNNWIMKDLFSKTSTVVVLLILVGGAVIYFGMKANKKVEAAEPASEASVESGK